MNKFSLYTGRYAKTLIVSILSILAICSYPKVSRASDAPVAANCDVFAYRDATRPGYYFTAVFYLTQKIVLWSKRGPNSPRMRFSKLTKADRSGYVKDVVEKAEACSLSTSPLPFRSPKPDFFFRETLPREMFEINNSCVCLRTRGEDLTLRLEEIAKTLKHISSTRVNAILGRMANYEHQQRQLIEAVNGLQRPIN